MLLEVEILRYTTNLYVLQTEGHDSSQPAEILFHPYLSLPRSLSYPPLTVRSVCADSSLFLGELFPISCSDGQQNQGRTLLYCLLLLSQKHVPCLVALWDFRYFQSNCIWYHTLSILINCTIICFPPSFEWIMYSKLLNRWINDAYWEKNSKDVESRVL